MRSSIGTTCAAFALLLGVAASAGAQTITWDGNVSFNNTQNSCNDAATGGFLEANVLTTAFTHNRFVNPALVNGGSKTAPDFRPTFSSGALCANFHPVISLPGDGFFTQTIYSGALDVSGSDWTSGWTTYDLDGNPTDFDLGKPLVVLTGVLATQALSNTNNYIIEGRVSVPNGRTLTIPAGTHLFGSVTVTPSYLVIERGGQLSAIGTPSAPIIFTSENAAGGTANSGNWGGVVLHGRACANCANTAAGDSCQSEGGAGSFGGTDDTYNAGTMQYCRIEFAGFELSPNNELNCLTMNALGTGTSVNYIQAHRGSDDLFEWFGGASNHKYLIGTWGQDDGLDFQMGYRGKVQFAIIQQRNLTGVDKAIEGDNNEFNHSNPLCRSNPTFANLTLVGTRATEGDTTTFGGGGVHFRRGARGAVLNSIVWGFRNCAFDFDDAETVAGGFGPNGTAFCSATSGVIADGGPKPGIVSRSFPNPFQASTTISFNLPESGNAKVRVFTLSGQLVETLADGVMPAGENNLTWSAPSDRSNGIYFYTVETANSQATGRLVSVR